MATLAQAHYAVAPGSMESVQDRCSHGVIALHVTKECRCRLLFSWHGRTQDCTLAYGAFFHQALNADVALTVVSCDKDCSDFEYNYAVDLAKKQGVELIVV